LFAYHTNEEKSYDVSLRPARAEKASAQVLEKSALTTGPDALIAQKTLQDLQFELRPEQRDLLATALAHAVQEVAPGGSDPIDQAILEQLREDGLYHLKSMLSPAQAAEIVTYFRQLPCYRAHVAAYSDGIAQSVEQAAQQGNYGSYRLKEALAAPYLLDLAMNPYLLAIAESYLGCQPALYSLHVWWTFAGQPQPGLTHAYHRDQDDYRFLAMFVYLTDVEADDGPVDLLKGTHRIEALGESLEAYRHHHPELSPEIKALHFFPPLARDGNAQNPGRIPLSYEAFLQGHKETLTGPAGTCFIADTFALHRGNPPSRNHRLSCWIRYGISKNRVYMSDRTEPVPVSLLSPTFKRTARTEWITRLLIDWSS
ncbi:MAG TPA: phytanoyl-CoA dioxygenase family protein, partial [Candidatus Obscuribacterales bacterium]